MWRETDGGIGVETGCGWLRGTGGGRPGLRSRVIMCFRTFDVLLKRFSVPAAFARVLEHYRLA